MIITVVRVRTAQQLEQAWAIRKEVFIDEQGVSEAEELDGLDQAATTVHVLALAGAQGVGTARLVVDAPGRVQIGRVAVTAAMRGRGIGALMMAELENIALRECTGPDRTVRIELSAQETALAFYQRLGYTIDTARYLDARIWHRDAHKVLRA